MLKEYIVKNGGATVNHNGELTILKTGYQLSVKNMGCVKVADFTDDMINNAIKSCGYRGKYAGFWIDNGSVYIDISERVASKKVAIEKGRELGELAVYDWKRGCCVSCGG